MVCRACMTQAFRLITKKLHRSYKFSESTRTAIVDGVAEILVVLHNFYNLVRGEGTSPSVLGVNKCSAMSIA